MSQDVIHDRGAAPLIVIIGYPNARELYRINRAPHDGG
jgi:hypothetical protein